jgi:iron complex outermembrane receptor protein
MIATDRFISTGNLFDLGTGARAVFENPLPLFNPQFTFLADTQDNFAWAIFGEISYDFSDLLEMSVAFRYDHDFRKNTTDTPPQFIPGPLVGIAFTGQQRKETWDDLQPKVTLRFKPSADLTMYLGYSRGFRSGGFNQTGVGAAGGFVGLGVPGVNDIFDQETADTIEGGIKATFLDDRVRTSMSVYKTRARGSYFFVFDPGTSTQNLGNIDKVDYQGFEVQASALVAEGLDLNIGLGYTDSEIEDFFDPAAIGNQAPLVSEYTLNLGGQYRRPLPFWPAVNGFVRADYQIIGPTYWDPYNYSTRRPVNTLDLRFGVEGETWSLTAWSKNLNDEKYNAEWSPGPGLLGILPNGGPADNFVFKAPPQRWGVDLAIQF